MKLSPAWQSNAAKSKNWDIDLSTHLANTGQDKLYQAPILQSCLNTLVDQGLIEEAYLRGSFRTGTADSHSDVDLFVVADDKNLEKTLQAVRDFLNSRMNMITDCYDRYVPPYGGLGFMFLCEEPTTGNILQFDLYMAIKGVNGTHMLTDTPRMYSKDPSYRWTDDKQSINSTEHLTLETKKFIDQFKNCDDVESRARLTFDEFMVVMHVAHKHIERRQTGRVMNDDAFLSAACASMLEEISGCKVGDVTPLYNVNRVINICRTHGDAELSSAATRLEALLVEAPTRQKLDSLYYLTKDMFMAAYPQAYQEIAPRVAIFENSVMRKPDSASPKPLTPSS